MQRCRHRAQAGRQCSDRSVSYDGAVNGVILFKSAAGAGVHSWCETVAPVGYALARPSCGTLTAQYETDYAVVLKHKAL